MPKQGLIKSCRCARECFICTCICYRFELIVTGWCIIATLVLVQADHFSLIFIAFPTSILKFDFVYKHYLVCSLLWNISYSYQIQVYYVATILYTIVCMDYVNLVWLDPFPCKTLLQLMWPYTGEGVVTQVWNYVLQCLQCLKKLYKSVRLTT